MPADRADLNNLGKKPSYPLLTVTLSILSLVGIFFLFRLVKSRQTSSDLPVEPQTGQTEITDIPPPEPTPTLSLLPSPTTVADVFAPPPSPTATISAQPLPSTTSALPTPTPPTKVYTDPSNLFSITHSSSRQVSQAAETGGQRFTFYRPDSKYAIHVGTSWSWSHPGREFTNTFLVSDQPTFRYDITAQTIVDFEARGKKITIQCIHNGLADLKSECLTFLQSFKLL